VQAWVGARDADDVLAALDAASVPCSRVNSVADIFADAQVRARQGVIEVEGPDGRPLSMPGIVPKLSRTPGEVRWSGSWEMGEHNAEVLGSLAGVSDDELASLQADGVV
jgi:crotonobetainyl-CoA:carnitine CoA-transferase CaiB-like acyl-CoA transferase